jgi:hypothetical protein
MTASGVVFITLEDEEGFLNLILYAHVFERFHHVATTASLLVAHGTVEREPARPTPGGGGVGVVKEPAEVVYLVTARLERLSLGAVDGLSMSRDFH